MMVMYGYGELVLIIFRGVPLFFFLGGMILWIKGKQAYGFDTFMISPGIFRIIPFLSYFFYFTTGFGDE
jgi:hypothetical protein